MAASLVLAMLGRSPGQSEASPGKWPFGPDPLGGDFRAEKRDLYNLGILGAKARDADVEPAPKRAGRIVGTMAKDKSDGGPKRLKIELLFPGGPAEKAGLKVGDVVLGVNQKTFDEGSLGPIATALLNAESQPKGQVVLEVERVGKKGPERVSVKIAVPSGGAPAKAPFEGAARLSILQKAAAFLAESQGGDGGFPATLSGTNGVVVQASLAGMVWLSLGGGKYSANVERAQKFVLRNVDAPDIDLPRPGGANWNQSNWGYVHAAIFLAELEGRKSSPLIKRELQRIANEIAKRQEASGGFAHGPGGKNALDYLELNIMTSLAVLALGSASEVGVRVDPKVVALALDYLEASASAEGGVGYSTGQGQKGEGNIGRTAAAWLGAENLGEKKRPFLDKMKKYVGDEAGNVLNGHASLMQHILFAGVASHAHGSAARKLFCGALERDLVLARAPNGSLQPRPWHESLSMSSNSDVSFGEIWTTAAWALVLASDSEALKIPGLPVWMGRHQPKKSG